MCRFPWVICKYCRKEFNALGKWNENYQMPLVCDNCNWQHDEEKEEERNTLDDRTWERDEIIYFENGSITGRARFGENTK